jgi:hypothetical protein
VHCSGGARGGSGGACGAGRALSLARCAGEAAEGAQGAGRGARGCGPAKSPGRCEGADCGARERGMSASAAGRAGSGLGGARGGRGRARGQEMQPLEVCPREGLKVPLGQSWQAAWEVAAGRLLNLPRGQGAHCTEPGASA